MSRRMKIVFHAPGHIKNRIGLELMCKAAHIELEVTHDNVRIQRDDYDLLILNSVYVDPSTIPSRIKIIYGPQHFVFPKAPFLGAQELSSSDGQPRIVYNALSPWVKAAYAEFGSLRFPVETFPFAVDVEKFSPTAVEKKYDCLVYIKHREQRIVDTVLQIVGNAGLVHKIFQYGSYNEATYLSALQESKFMVVVDAHESQGFALQEAMACGVPLLVLDATSMYDEFYNGHQVYAEHKGQKTLACSSVPYWSPACGIRITELSEFEEALAGMAGNLSSFSPREFVLTHLSARPCIQRILEYFALDAHLGERTERSPKTPH